MVIDYTYNSTKETAEQYHARIAAARGETSGELAGGKEGPADATSRMSGFNAALNVAVDQARQQRGDKTMDFMNGVVPPGALPATSFAQMIKSFQSDSAPLEATLVKSASDFAIEQQRAKEEVQNNIRNLALEVGKNGGSQETVNAITALIESGDIDAAIKVGATALQEWEQVGSNIITRNSDGSVKVIYSAPETPTSPTKAEEEDATVAAAEGVMLKNVGSDGKTNPAIYMDFYNDWVSQNKPEADFFKMFPPDKWLSYVDTTIPQHIKNLMKAPAKEKETITNEKDAAFGTDEYYDSRLQ